MSAKRPNILLIMADQLAAPALPIYGHSQVLAPNISRLADGGVVFENSYCNFPMCGPSRASLHAGVLPHSIDCFDNAAEFHADIPTIAHYLRSIDYKTWLCGKMHFVGPDQLHGYQKRLTTEIYPANFAWTVDWSKGREYRPTNLTMAPVIESGPCIRTLQMDYDDEVTHHAVQGIYDLARAADDDPFLLTVSFTHPHSPFVIAQQYWDRYDHDSIVMPRVGEIPPDQCDLLSENLYYCQARHQYTVTSEHVRNARHAYYGMVSYIDDKIGQILDTLEQTGLAEDTVVIFTADHGEMMGERGMWYKQHFWQWAANVPLVIRRPGQPAGRVTQNVSLVDLLPTMIDLATDGAGLPLATPIHGNSLCRLMDGNDPDWPDEVISEYTSDGSTGPSRMVRLGPWKYMEIEGVDQLLFNLDDDPDELDNRVDDPTLQSLLDDLRARVARDWDIEEVRARARANQRRRLLIHSVTGGDPTYVHKIREDDDRRYIRNAGAADTKARARLPYVAPAQPDKDDSAGAS